MITPGTLYHCTGDQISVASVSVHQYRGEMEPKVSINTHGRPWLGMAENKTIEGTNEVNFSNVYAEISFTGWIRLP